MVGTADPWTSPRCCGGSSSGDGSWSFFWLMVHSVSPLFVSFVLDAVLCSVATILGGRLRGSTILLWIVFLSYCHFAIRAAILFDRNTYPTKNYIRDSQGQFANIQTNVQFQRQTDRTIRGQREPNKTQRMLVGVWGRGPGCLVCCTLFFHLTDKPTRRRRKVVENGIDNGNGQLAGRVRVYTVG